MALPTLEMVAHRYNELGTVEDFCEAVAELENVISLPTSLKSASTTIGAALFYRKYLTITTRLRPPILFEIQRLA